jgi:hypothetical protein
MISAAAELARWPRPPAPRRDDWTPMPRLGMGSTGVPSVS